MLIYPEHAARKTQAILSTTGRRHSDGKWHPLNSFVKTARSLRLPHPTDSVLFQYDKTFGIISSCDIPSWWQGSRDDARNRHRVCCSHVICDMALALDSKHRNWRGSSHGVDTPVVTHSSVYQGPLLLFGVYCRTMLLNSINVIFWTKTHGCWY